MHSAPSGNVDPETIIPVLAVEAGARVQDRMPSAPRHIVRSGKRHEDTVAGCRANAVADLDRAHAPGGDFMRARLEHSARVWTERADLLERLDKKFQARTRAA